MKTIGWRAAGILAGAWLALPAMAIPITFTISDTGSGSLNGNSFSNELITFTQVTDTAGIASGGCATTIGAPEVTTNTVTIAGVASGLTLSNATCFFDNGINVAGINDPGSVVLLAAENSIFSSYNMLTNFGPAAYGIYALEGANFVNEPTSGGP